MISIVSILSEKAGSYLSLKKLKMENQENLRIPNNVKRMLLLK